MTTSVLPLTELTTSALQLLIKEMGVVNTLRFISQFSVGFGNYTEERHQLFEGMTVDEIVASIQREKNTTSQ